MQGGGGGVAMMISCEGGHDFSVVGLSFFGGLWKISSKVEQVIKSGGGTSKQFVQNVMNLLSVYTSLDGSEDKVLLYSVGYVFFLELILMKIKSLFQYKIINSYWHSFNFSELCFFNSVVYVTQVVMKLGSSCTSLGFICWTHICGTPSTSSHAPFLCQWWCKFTVTIITLTNTWTVTRT